VIDLVSAFLFEMLLGVNAAAAGTAAAAAGTAAAAAGTAAADISTIAKLRSTTVVFTSEFERSVVTKLPDISISDYLKYYYISTH
jgi:hypothetical protein